jgi:hypothetical protein
MKKILLALAAVTFLAPSLTLAEGTATYNAAADTTINTSASGNRPVADPTQNAIATQENNWDKIAEKTGRDISYSYKNFCNSSGSCIKVDPPRFQR